MADMDIDEPVSTSTAVAKKGKDTVAGGDKKRFEVNKVRLTHMIFLFDNVRIR